MGDEQWVFDFNKEEDAEKFSEFYRSEVNIVKVQWKDQRKPRESKRARSVSQKRKGGNR